MATPQEEEDARHVLEARVTRAFMAAYPESMCEKDARDVLGGVVISPAIISSLVERNILRQTHENPDRWRATRAGMLALREHLAGMPRDFGT